MNGWRAAVTAGVLLALGEHAGRAAQAGSDREDLQALRSEVERLKAELANVVRRLEEKEQATLQGEPGELSQAQSSVKRAAPRDGGGLRSIRLRGLLNVDARGFVGGDGDEGSDTLLLRRARIIADGQIGRNITFQFTTEFGGSAVAILDANATLAFSEAFELKVGKFKTPIGLEVLQGAGATHFAERSVASALVPNRDVGVQLGGTLAGERVDYAVGVFNGTPGGTHSGNADVDTQRQLAGRLMVRPFASETWGGLSVGVGAGVGRHDGSGARAAGYRSEGQRTIFTYAPAVTADGEVARMVPQVDFRRGPLGVMGEHVTARLGLQASPGAPRVELIHEAWQLTAGYLVTGENSTYGHVTPRRDLDPAAGTWGAVELLARYAELELDRGTFPTFASPMSSAARVESWTAGVKWYLSRAAMFSLNYVRADFGLDRSVPFAAPAAAVLRSGERVVVSRFQLAF